MLFKLIARNHGFYLLLKKTKADKPSVHRLLAPLTGLEPVFRP